MAFRGIFKRLSEVRVSAYEGWAVDEGVVPAIRPAQPIGPPTKELLVKDLLPELEQAPDIKQRIEEVRKIVIPSARVTSTGWNTITNALSGITRLEPGSILSTDTLNNNFSALAQIALQQATYQQQMSTALQQTRRRTP